MIQFEDFRTEYAYKLLERYRYDHLCFNDDIQVYTAKIDGRAALYGRGVATRGCD